jgi:hypothetical protein
MLKKTAFCILILLVFISGCTTNLSEKNDTVQGTSAKFRIVSLDITPIVAEPGQVVTVNVKVTNAGETTGTNKLALIVNGAEEEVKDVTVASGVTQTVNFTLTRDASGVFDIKVAGFNETLRVKQAGAYPRLGNCYIAWPHKSPYLNYLWHPLPEPTQQLKSLARWDIIAVPYTLYHSAPESILQIKRLNPKIKILAWFPFGYSLMGDLKTVQSSNESWFLHFADTPGNPKPPEQRRIVMLKNVWGQSSGMNPASGWSTYLPNYAQKLMTTGLFDGVFYDFVGEELVGEELPFNNIDIDNDGIADSPDVVNREYRNGTIQLLKLTRDLLGPKAIILGAPFAKAEWSANSPYWDYANGLYQENALGTEKWSAHDFSKVWEIYETNMQKPAPPSRINWIGVDTNNKQFDDVKPDLPASELQKMRYGLAITLLDDGYFD